MDTLPHADSTLRSASNPDLRQPDLCEIVVTAFETYVPRCLPGYRDDRLQQEVALRVAETIKAAAAIKTPTKSANPGETDLDEAEAEDGRKNGPSGVKTLINADAGTGKTLACLLPMVLHLMMEAGRVKVDQGGNAAALWQPDVRMVYSTRTNQLVRQILERDGPVAIEAARLTLEGLGVPHGAIILAPYMGRVNFIDPTRVDALATLFRRHVASGRAASGRAASRRVAPASDAPASDAPASDAPASNAPVSDADAAMMDLWREFRPATFLEAEQMGLTLPETVRAADIALPAWPSPESSQAYTLHRAQAAQAHLLITNHAMTLTDARIGGGALGRRRLTVFDEADVLPDVASSLSDIRIDLAHMAQAVKSRIAAAPEEDERDDDRMALIDLALQAEKLGDISRKRLRRIEEARRRGGIKAGDTPGGGIKAGDTPGSHSSAFCAEVARLRDCAKAVLQGSSWPDGLGGMALARRDFLDDLEETVHDLSDWLRAARHGMDAGKAGTGGTKKETRGESESNRATALLSRMPLDGSPALAVTRPVPGAVLRRLWTQGVSPGVVCISATLEDFSRNPGGNAIGFVHFRRAMGWPTVSDDMNLRADMSGSVRHERFGAMRIVLARPTGCDRPLIRKGADDDDRRIGGQWAGQWTDNIDADDDGLPFTYHAGWASLVAACILKARAAGLNQDGGDQDGKGHRVLVQAASFRDCGLLGSLLAPHLPAGDLLVHSQGVHIDTLLAEVESRPHGVLVSPCCWDGVDRPGLFPEVVTPRIPFPPIDPLRQSLRRDLLAKGGWLPALWPALMDAAAKRLRQGMGRGLRRSRDSMRWWMLDPRFPMSPARLADPRMANPQTGLFHTAPGPGGRFTSLTRAIPERFLPALDGAEVMTSGLILDMAPTLAVEAARAIARMEADA